MPLVYRYAFPAMWLSWTIYWWAASRDVKSTVRRESLPSRLSHIVPLAIAVLLFCVQRVPIAFLGERFLPLAEWPFWLGSVLTAGGLLFTVWARLHLGKNWSGTVTIKKDHELITSGPYAIVRHPIYTGLLLAFLGSALALGDWRGVLCGESPTRWVRLVAAFRQGLSESGYVEGKNIGIEFRWAEGHDERLPDLANDMVRRRVAVLVTTGGPNPVLAAKAATTTIPIVFTLGSDPVKLGIVASLGRPGGNITGIGFNTAQLTEKRLQLLHELVPKATAIAVMVAPDNPLAESQVRLVGDAARALGLHVPVVKARTEQEIDAAFTELVQLRAGALLVGNDGFFFDRREQFAALASRYGVPACFDLREHVEAGGLMSYGANLSDVYRQAGMYTGRILSGVKPAELPVLQASKVELVVNMKTARALGLTLPQSFKIIAEELIS